MQEGSFKSSFSITTHTEEFSALDDRSAQKTEVTCSLTNWFHVSVEGNGITWCNLTQIIKNSKKKFETKIFPYS